MHREDFDETRTCAADLIAYLYGELNEKATARFEKHLVSCAACREELASFSRVRVAIGEWREAARVAAMDQPTLVAGGFPNGDVRCKLCATSSRSRPSG